MGPPYGVDILIRRKGPEGLHGILIMGPGFRLRAIIIIVPPGVGMEGKPQPVGIGGKLLLELGCHLA
ncbi:hypothetical protein D3C76_1769030 [compost metagenome]